MSFFCDDVDTALGGYHTSAYTGLGVRGDQVPSTGADGPSALYPCLSLPADAATEVFMQLTRLPTLGTLAADEDGSFYYSGATDYFEFRLWINGIAATADVGYGAGIVRVQLNVGATSSASGTDGAGGRRRRLPIGGVTRPEDVISLAATPESHGDMRFAVAISLPAQSAEDEADDEAAVMAAVQLLMQ